MNEFETIFYNENSTAYKAQTAMLLIKNHDYLYNYIITYNLYVIITYKLILHVNYYWILIIIYYYYIIINYYNY